MDSLKHCRFSHYLPTLSPFESLCSSPVSVTLNEVVRSLNARSCNPRLCTSRRATYSDALSFLLSFFLSLSLIFYIIVAVAKMPKFSAEAHEMEGQKVAIASPMALEQGFKSNMVSDDVILARLGKKQVLKVSFTVY